MDVFAVSSKSTAKTNTLSRNADSGAVGEDLAALFSNLVRNAGTRLESGATTLVSPAERPTTPREAEPTARVRENRPERRDEPAAADTQAPRRARAERANDRKTTEAGKSSDTPADDRQAQEKPAADDTATSERADAASTDKKATDGTAKSEDRSGKDGQPAETQGQAAATDKTATGKAAGNQAAEAAAAAAAAEAPADEAMLAASLLAAHVFTQGAAAKTESVKAAADTPAASETLSASVKAVGQGAGDAAVAPDGTTQTVVKAPHAAATKTADLPFQAQATQDATANPAVHAADVKTQQAAALTKMTGDGNPIAVRTTVSDPASQLVSQPTATLSASAVAATDTAKTAATAAATPTATPLHPLVNPALANGAVNPLAAQADPLEAQAAGSQTAALSGDAAKAAIQALGPANGTGPQTSSGGGENLAGNGAQAPTQNTPAQQSSAAQNAQQTRFTLPQQTVADQISVQISKAVKNGVDRINIQLRPEHMGRVDVRLEVGSDGRVQATVTADNKGTLDMLQRDARELERALQQAGLQTDTGSLNFSLRGQNGQGQEGDRQMAGGYGESDAATAAEEDIPASPVVTSYPDGIRPDGRIDIRA